MDFKAIAQKAVKDYRAAQHPEELAPFLAWLSEVQPRFIVEIGMYCGGNLWAMQQVVSTATFIGVEPGLSYIGEATKCPLTVGTILLVGREIDEPVMRTIKRICIPEETLMYFDSSHSWRAVMKQSALYPAKYHAYHDVKDDRKPWKVAKMFADNREQFIQIFSVEEHRGGIGVRLGNNDLR